MLFRFSISIFFFANENNHNEQKPERSNAQWRIPLTFSVIPLRSIPAFVNTRQQNI
jgi:hypothetical protein